MHLSRTNKALRKVKHEDWKWIDLNAASETAKVFGRVKQELKISGTAQPVNDVWIAAHTLETGSTLIAYDRRFQSPH